MLNVHCIFFVMNLLNVKWTFEGKILKIII